MYKADGKENTEDEDEDDGDVKGTYILLPGTLTVVVTSLLLEYYKLSCCRCCDM